MVGKHGGHFCVLLVIIIGTVESNAERVVNHSHKHLTTIPHNKISKRVTTLDLSRNELTKLTNNEFERYTLLIKLHLENNKIDTVTGNAFIKCPSLELLDLSDNYLESFPRLTSVRTTLKKLYLNGNKLTDIASIDINEFIVLTSLTLEGNGHTQAETFGVNPCAQLHSCVLSSILKISQIFFMNCGQLKQLTLYNGSFRPNPLTDSAFTHTPLVYLRMIYMNLKSFPNFPKLGQTLEVFWVHYNAFPEPLLSEDFENLVKLELLSLKYCSITTFPEVTPLASTLNVLVLDKNNITFVPSDIFKNFTKLRTVKMTGNPLGHIPTFGYADATIQLLELNDAHLTTITCEDLSQFKALTRLDIKNNFRNGKDILSCDCESATWPSTLAALHLTGGEIGCIRTVRY